MGPPLVHGRGHGKGRPKLPQAGFLPAGTQVAVAGMQAAMGRMQVTAGGMQAATGRMQVTMGRTWAGP